MPRAKKASSAVDPQLTKRQQRILENKLKELESIELELQRRDNMKNPMFYGLPDLMFPIGYKEGALNRATGEIDREPFPSPETEEEYKKRQEHAIKDFIENSLHFLKEGRQINVKFIDTQVRFIADLLHGRVTRAILWKARGGGGSLCAAILIWLALLYKHMSFVDLGGSMEQSRVVYDYVSEFWNCFPDMKTGLLEKDPLLSMTKLVTGVQLKCIVPGTMVLTSRGILPVESVVVGDKIVDGNGKFSPVKMTITRRHRGEIIRITPVGYGRGVETTLDHKMWAMKVAQSVRRGLQRGEQESGGLTANWTEAQDLEVGDVLPVPKLATDPSPKTLVLENLRSRRRGAKPLVSLPITADFYRLLGYMLADGSSYGQWISISFGERELDNVADCVGLVQACLNRKACVLSRPSTHVRIVHFSFMAFARWFRDNCGKEENKELPLWLLSQATDDELRSMLTGIIRGDGGFGESNDMSGTKRKMQFTNTSSKLTQAVMLACQRLGFIGGLVIPNRRYSTIRGRSFLAKQQYIWQVTGSACDRLAVSVGHEWDENKSKSKSFQQGWHDASYVYRPIKSVERKSYDGPVIDLVVDGHPSFTLPGALVHNCITASEKMARGKHLPGLVADEACQDDVHADTTFKAAMNITMSEPEHMIVLLSTFHIPIGLFQQVWDNADAKGFTRYKWDIFDVMQKCEAGLEDATPEDPDAVSFCKSQCPLTVRETVYDEDNKAIGQRYIGCDGKARRSCGFLPRENVINALVMNEGSEVFWIEYACTRPRFSGPIYGLEAIENTVVSEIKIDDADRTIVGIDWGVNEGVLVLGKDSPFYGPQIIATKYLSVKLTSEYIRTLDSWKDEYGELDIYADAAGQFNIGDLEEAGYAVTPVDFGSMKDYGISNLTKLFMYEKIQILDDNTRLIEQLKSYRRDPKTGKPLKIDDHGPDALLCATIEIDFLERWSDLLIARSRGLVNPVPIDDNTSNTDEGEVEEKAIDRDNGVMLF